MRKLDDLLEMNTEDLLGLLPNNICDGKGDKVGNVYSPTISKNIEGKYFVEYSSLKFDTVYKERKILFSVEYAKDIKMALAESIIRVEEITKNLLKEQ